MPAKTIKVDSAAEAYLTVLKDRGVDYLFGNAGTDFPSIIEGLSKSLTGEGSAPTPVTVPHENLGVAMAHGFYVSTGRMAAVMVHVNVGTANAICGIMNAARENVPILMTSGRTPLTEEGYDGSRSLYIHWGQEMFDQAGVLREMVKWDYELRNTKQIETIVDRAVSVAMSEPRGRFICRCRVKSSPRTRASSFSSHRPGAFLHMALHPIRWRSMKRRKFWPRRRIR